LPVAYPLTALALLPRHRPFTSSEKRHGIGRTRTASPLPMRCGQAAGRIGPRPAALQVCGRRPSSGRR